MSDRFRNRMIAALEISGMTIAELSRRSGVSYDAINKLKRRENASTSMENAEKISAVLGIVLDRGRSSSSRNKSLNRICQRCENAELQHNEIGVFIRGGKIAVNAAVDKEGLATLREMLDTMEHLLD